LYHYGNVDLEQNVNAAENYYLMAVKTTRDPTVVALANASLRSVNTFRTWTNPSAPFYNIQKPKPTKNNSVVNIDTVFRVPMGTKQPPTINPQINDDDSDADAVGVIRNDMHNVHDHTVITTLKKSYDKLSKDTPIKISKQQVIKEARSAIDKYAKHDMKKDA